MRLSYEEKRKRVQEFRPIDDTFFEVFANDVDVCQEILRVILQDPNLEVETVSVQTNYKNMIGRSVRLDALCTLGDGGMCNIEVQRADNDDHLRRARYHAACLTAGITDPGRQFKEVPGVLHNDVSAEFESFQDHLLEYPQYSRPETWHGKQVPPILLSGHHANIEKWRREQSIIRTAENRPDLLEKAELTEKEQKFLEEYRKNSLQS